MVIAALALLAAVTTAADTRKMTDVENFGRTSKWSLFQSFKDDVCVAETTYEPNKKLSVHWMPRKDNTVLFYDDPKMESLVDGKEYEVDVLFRRGQKIDDGWGKRTAHASRTTDNVPELFFGLSGKVALTDISSNELIALFYKEKLVAALRLDDSASMVAELMRCGAQIVANHPIDPFEE